MAKKQTRRTISLNRALYESVMAHAEKRGMSAAHLVEQCLREKLGIQAAEGQHVGWRDAQRNASLMARARGFELRKGGGAEATRASPRGPSAQASVGPSVT